MKKISPFLIYIISFLYLEFAFRAMLYSNIFRLSNINMVCYIICFSLIMYFLTKLFSEKTNKILFYIVLFLVSFWIGAQFVIKSFFDFYISFSTIKLAGQVGDGFMGDAVMVVVKRVGFIILLLLPFIVSLILKKKINFKRNKPLKSVILVVFAFISYAIFCGSLFLTDKEDYSAKDLYIDVDNVALQIEKVGVLNTAFTDIRRQLFGFESKLVIIKKKEEPKEIIYEYNNLNIDFQGIIDNERDSKVKEMAAYFMNESGTLQNEYTSFFERKNLILFMAESFNGVVLDEQLTPNLYKLANSSFVFDNFYSPTIASTIGGEMQELTGLYPKNYSGFKTGKTSYPMGIANLFKDAGYNVYAYHNNSGYFQSRNLYLEALGFDYFKACYIGMSASTCSGWPESDTAMIEETFDEYADSDKPFLTYYVTVSGHGDYNSSSAMAQKYADEIRDLPYSSKVKYYIAGMMETDAALGLLIEKLDDAGILDDTVIALVGDHYPYYLSTSEVNEMSSYKRDDVVEINHSAFILYNSTQKTTHIDKVGSQIDVMPTLYNLFGLPYDSRLYAGKDIFSTAEGLAIFGNGSWISDKGVYYSRSSYFASNVENDETDYSEYVSLINQEVQNKIDISYYMIDKDFYRIAFNYLKASEKNKKTTS